MRKYLFSIELKDEEKFKNEELGEGFNLRSCMHLLRDTLTENINSSKNDFDIDYFYEKFKLTPSVFIYVPLISIPHKVFENKIIIGVLNDFSQFENFQEVQNYFYKERDFGKLYNIPFIYQYFIDRYLFDDVNKRNFLEKIDLGIPITDEDLSKKFNEKENEYFTWDFIKFI